MTAHSIISFLTSQFANAERRTVRIASIYERNVSRAEKTGTTAVKHVAANVERQIARLAFELLGDHRAKERERSRYEQLDDMIHIQGKNFDAAFNKQFGPENGVDLKKTYQKGKLKWTPQPKWTDGKAHNTLKGTNSANYLYRTIATKTALPVQLSLGADDGIRVWLNGREISTVKRSRNQANQIRLETILSAGKNELLLKVVNGGGPSGFYFKVARIGPPKNVAAIPRIKAAKRNAKQNNELRNWFAPSDLQWRRLDGLVKKHLQQQPKPKLTQIHAAKQRGTTYQFGTNSYKVFFLGRGNVDKKQGQAKPGFLRVLMTAKDQENRWLATSKAKPLPPRVALANWLTDAKHGAGQLLARVIVNRLWQHHFGRGIVATPNNFGTRGEPPTHPQLLNWLAYRLVQGRALNMPVPFFSHPLTLTEEPTKLRMPVCTDESSHFAWRDAWLDRMRRDEAYLLRVVEQVGRAVDFIMGCCS